MAYPEFGSSDGSPVSPMSSWSSEMSIVRQVAHSPSRAFASAWSSFMSTANIPEVPHEPTVVEAPLLGEQPVMMLLSVVVQELEPEVIDVHDTMNDVLVWLGSQDEGELDGAEVGGGELGPEGGGPEGGGPDGRGLGPPFGQRVSKV